MKKKKIHQGQVIGTGEKVFNIGMAILGILISLVVLYPIYYVLIASLSQPYYVENGDVMFAVKHFTLASYREAVKKSGIWLAYGNTIFYTVAGVAVNMLFTTTMAYALSKKKLVFRKFFTLFTIFTMWFAGQRKTGMKKSIVCSSNRRYPTLLPAAFFPTVKATA